VTLNKVIAGHFT